MREMHNRSAAWEFHWELKYLVIGINISIPNTKEEKTKKEIKRQKKKKETKIGIKYSNEWLHLTKS
jgi:hypothetical protein